MLLKSAYIKTYEVIVFYIDFGLCAAHMVKNDYVNKVIVPLFDIELLVLL